jgi:hypothetical protein
MTASRTLNFWSARSFGIWVFTVANTENRKLLPEITTRRFSKRQAPSHDPIEAKGVALIAIGEFARGA